jgi:TIR domain
VKYQLAVLGPNASLFEATLDPPLRDGFWKLGLNSETDFEVLREGQEGSIDWKGTPAGVWFGGPDTAPSAALKALQNRSAPVLPLVEDPNHYRANVPESLHPINGLSWTDPEAPADVLRSFRLTRELRKAFISYKRSDSQPVADALYGALNARKYSAFLDTASVESGVRFQDVLWDRLADMDLVILLDSPNALTSRWVYDELSRVKQLGLGVLQLIWPPPHKRFEGTNLCVPFDLEALHFEGGNSGPDGRLTAEAVKAVIARAEEVRIRSLGARRKRVVDELVRRAASSELQIDLHPIGPLTIREPALDGTSRGDAPIVGLALPIIGLPDAWSIHQSEKDLIKLAQREDRKDLAQIKDLLNSNGVRIVYDGLGVQADRAEHMVWLNHGLPLRTTNFDRSKGENLDPLTGWLRGLRREPGVKVVTT